MKTLLVGMLVLLAAACGGDGRSGNENPTPQAVHSIEIAPADISLNVGQSYQFSAVPKNSNGQPLTGKTLQWQSGDETKISVSATGLVTAHAEGSSFIRVFAEGKSDRAEITVSLPLQTVVRVELNSTAQTLEEGESFSLSAHAYDENDEEVLGRGVIWSSDAPAYVEVAPDGKVTALRAGNATVKVKIDGREAMCNIQVIANYAYSLIYSKAEPGEMSQLYQLDINPVVHDEQNVFPPNRQVNHASPSPDGSQIAFVVYGQFDGQSYWQSRIYVVNRDATGLIQLVTLAARNEQPAWSPDGSRIAFRSWVEGEASAILVIDLDGSNLQNLTADKPHMGHSAPAWSPTTVNGKYRLVYSSLENGNNHLWTMDEDGNDKQQLTFDPDSYDDEPDWSPDGSTIVFIRSAETIFSDLYLVNATGGNVRALNPYYPLPLSQYTPKWSPDGKLIAFASNVSSASNGNFDHIWTIWADGTKAVRRTTGDYQHADPNWLALE